MNLPTFSELPRRFACEATDVLARVNTFSGASLAGDARHAFLARLAELLAPDAAGAQRSLDDAREAALAELPLEDRVAVEAIPLEALERLGLGTVAPEVALAYDVATGECRELGRDLARAYDQAGRRPTEIVGATDRLSLIGSEGLYVGDYKGRSHTREPTKDEQFLAAALVGSRVHGRSWAEIEVIRFYGGEAVHARGRVERLELDAFEYRLQDLAVRIGRNRKAYAESGGVDLPEASEGPWCTYCAHARFCPAKMAICRATLGGDWPELLDLAKKGVALITPENAPKLYRLRSEGKKMLEQLGEALELFGRQTPFQLEDGRTYGVAPDAEERELGDGVLVAHVVAEVLGNEGIADLVLKKEAAFGRIDQAIKAHLGAAIKRGDLKKHNDAIEAKLLERGLLKVIKGGQVKAFTPKAAKAAKEKSAS